MRPQLDLKKNLKYLAIDLCNFKNHTVKCNNLKKEEGLNETAMDNRLRENNRKVIDIFNIK